MVARSRPSKRTAPSVARSSPPSSCSRVVLPDPLGPTRRHELSFADRQVDIAHRDDLGGALPEAPSDTPQLVDRICSQLGHAHRHSWVSRVAEGIGGTEAGGAKGADRAGDEAAEQREPDGEREQGDAHGRSEGDIRRAGRDCALPERPEARQSGLCALEARLKLRPERRDRRRACETEQQPEKAAEQTLHEGFTAHLADDEPLRPAERLQRPELAHALRHRGEREQAGDQERGEEADHGEGGTELAHEILRVHQRAGDAVGEVLGRGDGRAVDSRANVAGGRADLVGAVGTT